MMHFGRKLHFRLCVRRAQGLMLSQKVRNYGKVVFIKNMFENGWWGDASPPSFLFVFCLFLYNKRVAARLEVQLVPSQLPVAVSM